MTNYLRFTPVQLFGLSLIIMPGAFAMVVGLEPWWLATAVAAYGVYNGLSVIAADAIKRRRRG